jgi:Outer membrane protein beta-barrel domain
VFLILLTLLTATASAQFISLGIKGGVPLGQTLSGKTIDPIGILGRCGECASGRTLPYLIGPSIEVHLPRSFSVSVDALYNRTDYSHTSTTPINAAFVVFNTEKHAIDRLEIPVLLQYRLKPRRQVQPFVFAGATWQHNQDFLRSRQSGSLDSLFPFVNPIELASLNVPRNSDTWGPTFGAGARFGKRRFHPSIEYRYTYWTGQPIVVTPIEIASGPVARTATLHSNHSESQLIAGLMIDMNKDDAGRNASSSSGSALGSALSRITVGIKAGFPLIQAFEVQSNAFANNPNFGKCGECATQRTLPYEIGPAIEVRIVNAVSVTAEGLYSRADYNHTSSTFSASGSSFLEDTKDTVDRLEVPLMAKFGLARWRRLHPFVALGAAVQYNRDSRVQRLTGSHSLFGGTSLFQSIVHTPIARSAGVGPTFSAGTRIGTRRLSSTIEFRYTRWVDSAIAVGPFDSIPPVNGSATVREDQNKAQVLLGLMF